MIFNLRRIYTDYNELNQMVCEEFNIEHKDLTSGPGNRINVDARKALSYLMDLYRVKMTTTELGSKFGLSHSMIIYYVKKAKDMIEVNKNFDTKITNIIDHVFMNSFSQKDKEFIDTLMGCIVWPEGAVERGTTRNNFMRLMR